MRNTIEYLRVSAILLKPFIPNGTEIIYKSFNFSKTWEQVNYDDIVIDTKSDIRRIVELENGKVKHLYQRI